MLFECLNKWRDRLPSHHVLMFLADLFVRFRREQRWARRLCAGSHTFKRKERFQAWSGFYTPSSGYFQTFVISSSPRLLFVVCSLCRHLVLIHRLAQHTQARTVQSALLGKSNWYWMSSVSRVTFSVWIISMKCPKQHRLLKCIHGQFLRYDGEYKATKMEIKDQVFLFFPIKK